MNKFRKKTLAKYRELWDEYSNDFSEMLEIENKEDQNEAHKLVDQKFYAITVLRNLLSDDVWSK